MWWGDIHTLNIWEEEPEENIKKRKREGTFIEELNLSNRSYNRMKKNNCDMVEDIVKLIESGDIEMIAGLGEKSLNEIKEKVQPYM